MIYYNYIRIGISLFSFNSFFFICFYFLSKFVESHQGPHEKRLLNHLLRNYNTLERPVSNESETLNVRFGLTLQQIIDVVSSTFNESLTTHNIHFVIIFFF